MTARQLLRQLQAVPPETIVRCASLEPGITLAEQANIGEFVIRYDEEGWVHRAKVYGAP